MPIRWSFKHFIDGIRHRPFKADSVDSGLTLEYPEFQVMYEHAYDICLNIEKVMEMYSKELAELDRNTTLYMIDELQNELDNVKAALEESQKRNAELEQQLGILSQ